MADLAATFRKPFPEQVAAWRLRMGNQLPTAAWDDLWQSQHDRAFVVAGAVKADLLADLAGAVDKAITQGTTLEEFRRDFRAIVEARGWHGWTGEGTAKGEAWRTKVIYQTNMRTSYMAGRHAQLVAGEFAFWVYRHSGAKHPRLDHKSWDGVALAPDHPFWLTHYPPNGWGCGCDVYGARTAAGIKRVGGVPDKTLPDNWQAPDPRTGAPGGIDKGWDYAPGASVAEAVRDLVREKAARLPAVIAGDLTGATETRLARRRLPFEDAAPTRTATELRERALAAGVAEQIAFSPSMRLDGLAAILLVAQEVNERFALSPLAYFGSVDSFPWGGLKVQQAMFAGYVPGRDAIVIRAHVTDAAKVTARLAPELSPRYTAPRLAALKSAAPAVQARAAEMTAWSWSPVRDPGTLMIHELGHRLHRAHQGAIDALLDANGVWAEGWQYLISHYGTTNRSEFIAESFVLYLRGGAAEHARLHPALLEFFRKLDRLAP